MIFEYTKQNPKPTKAWNVISKLDLPNLTKVYMWMYTQLSTDFPSTKSTLQDIESGKLEQSQFINSFNQSLNSKFSLAITELTNPVTHDTLPDMINLLLADSAPLNSTELCNKLDISFNNVYRENLHSDFTDLSPLWVANAAYDELFADNFRTFFPPSTTVVKVHDKDNIPVYLREGLLSAARAGQNSSACPEFKLA